MPEGISVCRHDLDLDLSLPAPQSQHTISASSSLDACLSSPLLRLVYTWYLQSVSQRVGSSAPHCFLASPLCLWNDPPTKADSKHCLSHRAFCDDRNAPCSVSAAHYSNRWSCVAVEHVKCGNWTEFLTWFNDSGFPSKQPRAAGGYLMWRALTHLELHVAPAQPSMQVANIQRRILPSPAPSTSLIFSAPLYSSPPHFQVSP